MQMRLAAGIILAATLAGATAQAQTTMPTVPGAPESGVIKPPMQVDPGIKVPPPVPPATLPTPVIPPPGTAGGNQTVQPK